MTPQEFLDSQPKSKSPIAMKCELPPAGEDVDGLQAASSGCEKRISGPSTGSCGKWCWGVALEKRNMSCTDICRLSKDAGGPAVKVFVTGHGKLVLPLSHKKS